MTSDVSEIQIQTRDGGRYFRNICKVEYTVNGWLITTNDGTVQSQNLISRENLLYFQFRFQKGDA